MSLELLIPFLASLGITLFLRRLDKSNYRLSTIKHFASKVNQRIDTIGLEKVQEVKDAGIDLEIQMKKSKSIMEDLALLNIESTKTLENNKVAQKEVDDLSKQLENVLKISKQLREDSSYINSNLNQVLETKSALESLFIELEQIKTKLTHLEKDFEKRTEQKSKDLLETVATKIIDIEDLLKEKITKFDTDLNHLFNENYKKVKEHTDVVFSDSIGKADDLKEEFVRLNQNLFQRENEINIKIENFKILSSNLTERLNTTAENTEKNYQNIEDKLEEKFQFSEKVIQERMNQTLEKVTLSKEVLLDNLKIQVDTIKKEIETMTLDTFTRRDEILNETKRQSEQVKTDIEIFKEKYIEAEDRLLRQADIKNKELVLKMDNFENEFNKVSDNFRIEVKSLKEDVFGGLKNFHSDLEESRSKITEQMKYSLDSLKKELEEKLILTSERKEFDYKNKTKELEGLYEKIDQEITKKLQKIDTYTNDLKQALAGTSGEILTEVESKLFRFKADLENYNQILNEKISEDTASWDKELMNIKKMTQENIQSIQEQLKFSQLKSDELTEKLKDEYDMQKNNFEKFVVTHKINFDKQGEKIRREIDNYLEAISQEGKLYFENLKDEIELNIKKFVSNIKDNQKKAENKNLELKNQISLDIQKAKLDSEKVLDSLRESSNVFFEKQEDKISQLNKTIDLKISRQLAELLNKGELQLGKLEEKVKMYVSKMKVDLENSLKNGMKESKNQIEQFNDKSEETIRNLELQNEEFIWKTKKEFETIAKNLNENLLSISDKLETAKSIKREAIEELEKESNQFQNNIDATYQKMEILNLKFKDLKNIEEIFEKSEIYTNDLKNILQEIENSKNQENSLENQVNKFLTFKKEMVDYLEEFQDMKLGIQNLKIDLKKANHTQEEYQQASKQFEEKYSNILASSKKYENIEEVLGELDDKILKIETSYEKIEDMNQFLQKNFKKTEKVNQELDKINRDLKIIEAKEKEISDTMKQTDKKMRKISIKDEKIKLVEEKFSKIEDLLLDLDKKYNQISSLEIKADNLYKNIENLKIELENLLFQTEEKISEQASYKKEDDL